MAPRAAAMPATPSTAYGTPTSAALEPGALSTALSAMPAWGWLGLAWVVLHMVARVHALLRGRRRARAACEAAGCHLSLVSLSWRTSRLPWLVTKSSSSHSNSYSYLNSNSHSHAGPFASYASSGENLLAPPGLAVRRERAGSSGLLRLWFAAGGVVGVALMLLGVVVLWANLASAASACGAALLNWSFEDTAHATAARDTATGGAPRPVQTRSAPPPVVGGQNSGLKLQPVLPGVTVPASHWPYFLIALFLNAVVHELGHALAARAYNVGVEGAGVFLFLLYPGTLNRGDWMSLKRRGDLK